jgi:hypothetical protein
VIAWCVAAALTGMCAGLALGWRMAARDRDRLAAVLARWKRGEVVAVRVNGKLTEAEVAGLPEYQMRVTG